MTRPSTLSLRLAAPCPTSLHFTTLHVPSPRLTPKQVQFLYASLGGAAAEEPRAGGRGSAASWRAALASLKADYEQGYKYTGKV